MKYTERLGERFRPNPRGGEDIWEWSMKHKGYTFYYDPEIKFTYSDHYNDHSEAYEKALKYAKEYFKYYDRSNVPKHDPPPRRAASAAPVPLEGEERARELATYYATPYGGRRPPPRRRAPARRRARRAPARRRAPQRRRPYVKRQPYYGPWRYSYRYHRGVHYTKEQWDAHSKFINRHRGHFANDLR